MESRNCKTCKKTLPILNFDARKGSINLKKGCRSCLDKSFRYRHKNDAEDVFDPDFKFTIFVSSSTGCDPKELCKYADKAVVDRYYKFLRNLRNNVRIQIRRDLRFKEYNLEWLIKSGQLDIHGCYIESEMKRIREAL